MHVSPQNCPVFIQEPPLKQIVGEALVPSVDTDPLDSHPRIETTRQVGSSALLGAVGGKLYHPTPTSQPVTYKIYPHFDWEDRLSPEERAAIENDWNDDMGLAYPLSDLNKY